VRNPNAVKADYMVQFNGCIDLSQHLTDIIANSSLLKLIFNGVWR